MKSEVLFGVAISEEVLGDSAPVLIQGGLIDGIRKASALGFNSVEIHIRNPRTIDADALKRISAETGTSVSAVGTGLENSLNGLSLTSADNLLRRRTVDIFKEHIDLAAHFGATVFVGLCRDSSPESTNKLEYLDRLEDSLQILTPYAAAHGASLSLEPIASYMTNLLNSTEESLEFINRPGLESVMLLMDTHHMFFEDGDIRETFRMCEGRIDHVHISDSDRKYPGSGEIDFTMVGAALKEIGYNKAVSLEILPYPNPVEAAQKGLEWMHSIWGS